MTRNGVSALMEPPKNHSYSTDCETPQTNYYNILECSQDSKIDEIKANYRKLIRKFHPDKLQSDSLLRSNEQFILIDKAFKTLNNEQLRKEYDAFLLNTQLSENALIYAEIEKEKLEFSDEELAVYPCRCGQFFEISKDVLDEEQCLVECSECTNCILIK